MRACASLCRRLLGRGLYLGLQGGKWYLFPLLFLELSFQVFAQNSPPTGEFKISADVDLVLLDVSVKEPKGGYVAGLGKESFSIYENGVLQKITEFAGADTPVTIGLVVDDSGSMKRKRPEVLTAGLVFIGASNPKDQIFVIHFNDRVRIGLPQGTPFTDNIGLLRAALFRDPAQGQTALYDAIIFALDHLESGRSGKKALLLVSDGADNCSRHDVKDMLQLVEKSRATVYTVGLVTPEDPERNPQVLARIAKISGGESFLPRNLDEIAPICRNIARDIRARYTVGYTPIRTGGMAPLRKIRVVASAPDHGKLLVRTRSSYSMPTVSLNAGQSEPVK